MHKYTCYILYGVYFLGQYIINNSEKGILIGENVALPLTKGSKIHKRLIETSELKGDFVAHLKCSGSRRRAEKVDKRMVLEHTHGLFIT
jgi:hypothetical protein